MAVVGVTLWGRSVRPEPADHPPVRARPHRRSVQRARRPLGGRAQSCRRTQPPGGRAVSERVGAAASGPERSGGKTSPESAARVSEPANSVSERVGAAASGPERSGGKTSPHSAARASEPASSASGGVTLTWLGQAGFRLRSAEATVLVDPCLSQYDGRLY